MPQSASARRHEHHLRAPAGSSGGRGDRRAIRPTGRRPSPGRTWRTRPRPPTPSSASAGRGRTGTVMVCIHVPVFEQSAAEKKIAKSRCRSAANAPPELPEACVAADTGRIYRGPFPNTCSLCWLDWRRWWYRASARCSPGARSPSIPTRAGSARARRHQLGRPVPRPSARRRHRARRRGRLRAVAVRPAVHVRPHGRRPAPLVPRAPARGAPPPRARTRA